MEYITIKLMITQLYKLKAKQDSKIRFVVIISRHIYLDYAVLMRTQRKAQSLRSRIDGIGYSQRIMHQTVSITMKLLGYARLGI